MQTDAVETPTVPKAELLSPQDGPLTFTTIKPKRRTRTLLTPQQQRTLRKVLDHTAFPSGQLLDSLAANLNIPRRSVQIWFQNQRQKAKSKLAAVSGTTATIGKADLILNWNQIRMIEQKYPIGLQHAATTTATTTSRQQSYNMLMAQGLAHNAPLFPFTHEPAASNSTVPMTPTSDHSFGMSVLDSPLIPCQDLSFDTLFEHKGFTRPW